MKIIKNKIIPFNGYKAINIFGIIFTKGELSEKEINHELIHTKQMKEMLYVPFYIWYGIEYLIKLFPNKFNLSKTYNAVSFEQEAYLHQAELNYLEERKHYAWWQYLTQYK